jgi:cysteinyl-tRNA synthetase
MSILQFYNSLTRNKETFTPLVPGKVSFYTCGPTVYNFAHIGNFRAYLFEDLLRRTLKHAGHEVTQVMNLTDVDDKTIKGAIAAGVSLKDYTAPYIAAFFNDLKALNVEPAEHYPAATDYIDEMIALISQLIEKKMAYKSEDGSVYFKVSAFPDYGKLAHLDLANLRAGARVAQDEYEKESYGDFALWKAWDASDGNVVWDSPWGRGRPGWHIECSAMGMKLLGPSFDIHTGGIDNLFPHHENEIAQSEGATDKPFVRYWLHCAHLRVDGEKMSKSLGNFFTLREILERGYSGREVRFVLLNGHYRQPLNFTFEALNAARTTLRRLDEFQNRLDEVAGNAAPVTAPEWASTAYADFVRAAYDDLNLPEALAPLFELVRHGNHAVDQATLSAADAASIIKILADMDKILGLLTFERQTANEEIPAEVAALAEARIAARQSKNWAESDRLRDELKRLGWEVRDGKDGQKIKPLSAI